MAAQSASIDARSKPELIESADAVTVDWMRRALAAGAAGAVPAIADLHDLEVLPQIGGVGAARTKLAVRAIGTLHGRFWQAEGRPPLSACRTAPTPEFSRYLQIAYWVCLVSVFDSFGDLFSAQMRRVAEAFGLRMADHFAATAAGPRTFIHGDYRGENILFGTGGSDEVAVVDWQASGIGSGLYDLAYFLGTSLLIGDRRLRAPPGGARGVGGILRKRFPHGGGGFLVRGLLAQLPAEHARRSPPVDSGERRTCTDRPVAPRTGARDAGTDTGSDRRPGCGRIPPGRRRIPQARYRALDAVVRRLQVVRRGASCTTDG